MMDRKNIEDMSAYMLFEATGDSEIDYNPTTMDGVAHEPARNAVDDGDHDDAESCSYDKSDICDIGKINGCEPWNVEVDHVKKEDEDEALVYGTSYCTDDEIDKEKHCKSRAVDPVSGQDSLDEREKNRLFWESCLAS